VTTVETRPLASIRVVERTAEDPAGDTETIPWHLTPSPGNVALQLRRTVRRISVGSAIARKLEVLAAARALDDMPGVVTSPVGGTFVMGGSRWLGLCAIAVPPTDGSVAPLDWTMRQLRRWFDAALTPLHVVCSFGRVDGAWCAGFSDVAVDGRKLAGLGFRVTRERVVVRGVISIEPMSPEDFALLHACHALMGVDIRGESAISLAETTGDDGWTVPRALIHFGDVAVP